MITSGPLFADIQVFVIVSVGCSITSGPLFADLWVIQVSVVVSVACLITSDLCLLILWVIQVSVVVSVGCLITRDPPFADTVGDSGFGCCACWVFDSKQLLYCRSFVNIAQLFYESVLYFEITGHFAVVVSGLD